MKSIGVQTSAFICPVIPYTTEVIPLIEMLAEHTGEIRVYGLSIVNKSDRNWKNVDKILEDHLPDIKRKIERAVSLKENSNWRHIRQDLHAIANKKNLNVSILI